MARQKAVSEDIEKLIKRANQRLRQLEKDGLANQSKAYQFITNKAVKNMASPTKVKMFAYTSSGEIKFRTDLATLKKANKNVYKALVNLASGFTEAKSSTKIGIEEAHKQSYEGFKNKTGFSGTFSQFSDMWSNYEFQELLKIFNVSELVSMADDLGNTYGMSFDDVIHNMYEAYKGGVTSEWGMYDWFEEHFGVKEEDFDDVE